MVKSVCRDLGAYKQSFSSLILNSHECCEVMNCEEENIGKLLYSQIFPYLYVDETQTEVLPFLCFDTTMAKFSTSTTKIINLIVWAYCHKDCMKYSKRGYPGTRVDVMCEIVERLVRTSDDFGIGEPTLEVADIIFPNAKYYGKKLIFSIADFRKKKVSI